MLFSLRSNMSDAELSSDINAMEAEMAADTDSSAVSWGEVFKLKRAMLIGLGLMLFQPVLLSYHITTIPYHMPCGHRCDICMMVLI